MPYIGQPLNAGNLAVQTGTGDGSDTTPIFALTYSVGSSESVAIYLDGVKQAVSTYVASGTVLTFTTAPPNLVGIEVVFLALSISLPTPGDGTVTAAKIADNAVGLAQLASGTDGELFTWDASGDPAKVAVGTATHVLTSNGVGVAPTFQARSGWEFVSKVTASSSATVAFTDMASGYDYRYVFENIVPATDVSQFFGQVGISGPTYRTSLYSTTSVMTNIAATNVSTENTTEIGIVPGGLQELGTGTNEQFNGYMEILDPAGTANETTFMGHWFILGHDAQLNGGDINGLYRTIEAHTSIKFYMDAGNVASGNISQFRRVRS